LEPVKKQLDGRLCSMLHPRLQDQQHRPWADAVGSCLVVILTIAPWVTGTAWAMLFIWTMVI